MTYYIIICNMAILHNRIEGSLSLPLKYQMRTKQLRDGGKAKFREMKSSQLDNTSSDLRTGQISLKW